MCNSFNLSHPLVKYELHEIGVSEVEENEFQMQEVFFFCNKGSHKFENEHLVSCIDGLGYIFFLR